MDTDAIADESPAFPFPIRGLAQRGKPLDGHADLAAVLEEHMHHVLPKTDIPCQGVEWLTAEMLIPSLRESFSYFNRTAGRRFKR